MKQEIIDRREAERKPRRDAMLRLWEEGLTEKEIGKRYGVTEARISQVFRGYKKKWLQQGERKYERLRPQIEPLRRECHMTWIDIARKIGFGGGHYSRMLNEYGHIPRLPVGFRQCPKCRGIKLHSEFYRTGHECKECTKESTKERYHKHPEKGKCRTLAAYALKAGKIDKGGCAMKDETCEGRIEMHHDDYSKPLDITFYCRKHHRAVDAWGGKM